MLNKYVHDSEHFSDARLVLRFHHLVEFRGSTHCTVEALAHREISAAQCLSGGFIELYFGLIDVLLVTLAIKVYGSIP